MNSFTILTKFSFAIYAGIYLLTYSLLHIPPCISSSTGMSSASGDIPIFSARAAASTFYGWGLLFDPDILLTLIATLTITITITITVTLPTKLDNDSC